MTRTSEYWCFFGLVLICSVLGFLFLFFLFFYKHLCIGVCFAFALYRLYWGLVFFDFSAQRRDHWFDFWFFFFFPDFSSIFFSFFFFLLESWTDIYIYIYINLRVFLIQIKYNFFFRSGCSWKYPKLYVASPLTIYQFNLHFAHSISRGIKIFHSITLESKC